MWRTEGEFVFLLSPQSSLLLLLTIPTKALTELSWYFISRRLKFCDITSHDINLRLYAGSHTSYNWTERTNIIKWNWNKILDASVNLDVCKCSIKKVMLQNISTCNSGNGKFYKDSQIQNYYTHFSLSKENSLGFWWLQLNSCLFWIANLQDKQEMMMMMIMLRPKFNFTLFP